MIAGWSLAHYVSTSGAGLFPGLIRCTLDQVPLILGDIAATSDQPGKGRFEASLTAPPPEPS